MGNDYYHILGVDKSASAKDIREAYRALIRRLQGDTSPSAPEQIVQVNRAYEILSDPEERQKYTQTTANENSQETNPAIPQPAVVPSSVRHKRDNAFGWVVNLLILVIGVAIGFFGRPIVIPYPPDPQAVAMQTIASNTRHYKGSDQAPVTIIEFADFQ